MADPKGFMRHERRSPALRPVAERLRHHDEHYEDLTLEEVKTQASRCMDCGVPFCMSGCPLGNVAPEFNDLLHRGRLRQGLECLHGTNNFPEFTGRVCPAPCEPSGVLGHSHGAAVTIKLHEQTLVDRGFAQGWIRPQPPAVRSGKRVAVVGSGPAGLACAQQLNRAGHHVIVYEKNDRAGGLLMYGIPHYKLRKEKVQRRLDLLAAEGIEFVLGTRIGEDVAADALRADHDAVVLAIGAEQPRDLPVAGRELDGIHFAMEYLPQQNRRNWGDEDASLLHPHFKEIDAAGKQVIVIGGGDTGSDCIGTALRQGAKSVINFELLPEPPAVRQAHNPWPQFAAIKKVSSSIEEMLDRGGDVEYTISTKRFLGEGGRVAGLITERVDLSGGFPPRPVPDTEETWEADLVLLAMGFLGPDATVLDGFGIDRDQRGKVTTDPDTRLTSTGGIFAAGDCRRGQSLVVWAIAEGREIAACVDEYLTGRPTLLPHVRLDPFRY